jgi:MarR family transcriptional regulator, 2-MHQ and catechol-resistance regulon repressor
LSRQVLTPQALLPPAAWARLLRGHAAATKELSAQLVSEHGLTLNAYEALLLLARAEDGRLRPVDLAEQLVLTASGITRLLDGLEEVGLVERATCASDRRVSYAVITETGRTRLESASQSHISAVRALFEERFTEEELETLAELLGRLPGAGGAQAEDCSP